MKIIYILLIGLALRLPGIFWGQIDHPRYNVWEPDEFQHARIAEEQIHLLDDTYFEDKDFSGNWNSRAYGKQVGLIVYIAKQLNWLELTPNKIIFTGRLLSIFYSVLLILLVYKLAQLIFQDQKIALIAALFLSIFDLNITYSHYALPAISYVFWTYLSLYCIFLFYKHIQFDLTAKRSFYFLLVFLPAPFFFTFATKFDFLPLALFFLLLFVLFLIRKLSIAKGVSIGIWMLVGGAFYYLLAHGFSWNLAEAQRSFIVAKDLNEDIVALDQHLLHNPVVYFLAVTSGSSIFAIFLSIIACVFIFSKNNLKKINQQQLFQVGFLVFFLMLEFLVRWRMDTAFVRRANIFLPFVALMASYGLHLFLKNSQLSKRFKTVIATLVFVYTAGIAITSQYNFWNDTRYQSRNFLRSHFEGQKIKYSMYAKVKGPPNENVKKFEEADILVLHEAYYSRYWKTFTTPFKMPKCCDEVYHCHGKSTCQFFQEVLSDKSEYQLLKVFPTLEIFPERFIFKRLFGTYETFLGDVRIYQRNKK